MMRRSAGAGKRLPAPAERRIMFFDKSTGEKRADIILRFKQHVGGCIATPWSSLRGKWRCRIAAGGVLRRQTFFQCFKFQSLKLYDPFEAI